MGDLGRMSTVERELVLASARAEAAVRGGLSISEFEKRSESVRRMALGLDRFGETIGQVSAAQRAIEVAGGLGLIDERASLAERAMEAAGGIGQIFDRGDLAQRAIEAAGGFGSLSRRHEAAYMLGSTVGAAATEWASRSSAVDQAIRDLAGVGSFGSLLTKRLEEQSDRFTAMINGAIGWRSAGDIGSTLAGTMRSQFPDLYPEMRLATVADVARAPFGTLAERVIRDQDRIARLRDEMLGVRNPWVDVGDPSRSFTAYTNAVALVDLVRESPAESRRVVKAVRDELGDYKSIGSIDPEISSDPVLSTAFRIEHGFDSDLSSLPVPVLVSIFSWYGVKTAKHAVADPEALQSLIHIALQRLELRIRRFIEARLEHAAGARWYKRRVPEGIVDRWQSRRQTDIDNLRKPSRLFDYAGFEDYIAILERRDNWPVFATVFPVKSSLLEALRRLSLIRNPDAHFRALTVEDFIDLAVEGRRIFGWLNRVR